MNRLLESQDHVLNVVRSVTGEPLQQDSTVSPFVSSVQAPPAPSCPQEGYGGTDTPLEHSEIPSSHTVPDDVLNWQIFGGRYPQRYLQDAVFASKPPSQNEQRGTDEAFQASEHVHARRSPNYGFREEDIPKLIDRFLRHVHIKNPILDEEMLRQESDRVVEEGLGWDACSCLVVCNPFAFTCGKRHQMQICNLLTGSKLLACALGAIAVPFDEAYHKSTLIAHEYRNLPSIRNLSSLEEAEACFLLARRRTGLLSQSMVASQCFFLSGVYSMYSFRPLDAFQSFHQASITYQVYLKSLNASTRVSPVRRLEQRLFSSCFKSEW